MPDLVRLSMTIEKPLYEKLEQQVDQSVYSNRSEFIRDLIRSRLVEQQWQSNADSLGTVTLVYDHHSRGLGSRLTKLQHDFEGHVLASTHLHLDHHHCAEMIMVKGEAGEIRTLTDRMKREKGVLHASLAMSAMGDELA